MSVDRFICPYCYTVIKSKVEAPLTSEDWEGMTKEEQDLEWAWMQAVIDHGQACKEVK